jgi:hypothetical protein
MTVMNTMANMYVYKCAYIHTCILKQDWNDSDEYDGELECVALRIGKTIDEADEDAIASLKEVCMYACMLVCMYVCMYVWLCVNEKVKTRSMRMR